MLLHTKGSSYGIIEPIVGRITRNEDSNDGNSILISNSFKEPYNSNFLAVLSCSKDSNRKDIPGIYNIPTFDHLNEGDLVALNSEGSVNTLYRVSSNHNSLLVTERCNSNCLMCSQPPKNRNDIPYLFDLYKKLIPLIPKDCQEIGITGGEPTLMGDLFFELLQLIKDELPDTEIHCLTNGRSFAWSNMAERLSILNLNRLMLGIPLYSDYYQDHDYIVQAKDAFNQTLRGLHNLATYDQRIEIRIVLHKLTIPRLTKLAKYIYKNLPFVEHIAFMGLEYTGYTPYNIEKLWIDPFDYMEELEEAVEYLATQGMNVSIYNSQLCVLPETIWKYTRKSISDWKNIYLDECSKCSKKEECGGLFASCERVHSKHLKAFNYTF
jgi:His-Xaa-Ser system radical SAM maturase HxsC